MSEGVWELAIRPSPAPPCVYDGTKALVATLHAPRQQAAIDAILVTFAPEMLAALRLCAETFEVMAEHDPGPSGQIARDMYQRLHNWLQGPLGTWEDGPRTTAE